MHLCLLLLLLSRLSSVSVVFDFSSSLNNVAPVSPISLSFLKKKGWKMRNCVGHSMRFWCSQLRLSSVSLVFDFNASLNDVVPVSPMLFSVDQT